MYWTTDTWLIRVLLIHWTTYVLNAFLGGGVVFYWEGFFGPSVTTVNQAMHFILRQNPQRSSSWPHLLKFLFRLASAGPWLLGFACSPAPISHRLLVFQPPLESAHSCPRCGQITHYCSVNFYVLPIAPQLSMFPSVAEKSSFIAHWETSLGCSRPSHAQSSLSVLNECHGDFFFKHGVP